MPWPLPGTTRRKPAWLTGVAPPPPGAADGGVIWLAHRARWAARAAGAASSAPAPCGAGARAADAARACGCAAAAASPRVSSAWLLAAGACARRTGAEATPPPPAWAESLPAEAPGA